MQRFFAPVLACKNGGLEITFLGKRFLGKNFAWKSLVQHQSNHYIKSKKAFTLHKHNKLT
ncbi:MAG: hypothetical protein DRR16_30905 [Candidatus Parabeggiatoa sp. nov. 3]|nr:MAG: hypothetical protein DRR16_30905 [Gammaproteobacteria bacterium]